MAIAAGTKLGRYEIRSQLGAGGMGEVYRARDEKLNRDVAIKVLPAALSQDGDRLRRFEQEAQAAGALNHPNILAVYDVGTHDGAPYVVSELLEGYSLKERLGDGPLAQRKTIDYAVQVAHGLAAAHEKGIVHRDLKPDNLFVTKDDRIKILDFGLAKLVERVSEGAAQTDIATRKVQTDPGTVMGTVGYMSPEQVRGRAVDHRSDIFSFGAVLYEMLCGRRAFHGDSAVETLNAILKEEPPELTKTNPNIAPALERVIWHCLEKSPERRFQSATDVAFALESLTGVSSSGSTQATVIAAPSRTKNRERLLWIAVTALLFFTALAFAYFSRSQPTTHAVRLAFATPEKATLPGEITVSPDGLRVAFTANNAEGKRLLWVRSLDSLNAQPLPGTEGAKTPFWSPDSRFIGFFAGGKLNKIDASGGRPQTLCDAPEPGGAWNRDGVIIFSGGVSNGFFRISASGGSPTPATKLGPKEEAHRWPYFLPDGRHFVFLGDAQRTEDHHLRVGSLDSPDSQILLNAVSRVAYAAGYLLFVRQGTLVAQPFDANNLKLSGEPVTIAEHVADLGNDHEFDFSVSDNGVLAYQIGNPNSQLTWFDRTGKEIGTVGEPANYVHVALSPDERRAAVELLDADGRNGDVWLFDLSRGTPSRLTFDPQWDSSPLWSPDGTRILFCSNRSAGGQVNLYEKAANGAGEDHLLLQSDGAKYALGLSKDGQLILYDNFDLKTKEGIWILPLTGDRQPKPYLQTTDFDQAQGRLSPDGRWVAYSSNESGRWEIYVQSFPSSSDKHQISSGGGGWPLWRNDGKELFYISNDNKLMAVDIKAGNRLESGVPKALFPMHVNLSIISGYSLSYAVTADGQRFLINTLVEGNNPAPMTIVLNWTADLRR
jgi:serine/threonine protein kinase/Tol biopolymer transport system component